MARVLVTGGAGFIGSHLVPTLLRSGFEVRVLDNLSPQIHGTSPAGLEWLKQRGIEFLHGSVTVEADVRRALSEVDHVIHLAAETGTGQSMYEIARYTAVNVQGTALFLDVLANDSKHKVKRVVLASSRAVYGEGAYVCEACSPGKRVYPDARSREQLEVHSWEPNCQVCGALLTPVPVREDDHVKPASIYAATKLAQEDLVRIACSSLNIGHAIFRLQNVYGERQALNNPYTGILSIFSTRIRRGLHLPIFEDGRESRDFVHVDDVAQAILASLTAKASPNQVINVGSGSKTTIFDIAENLSNVFGVTANLIVTNQYRLGDIRHNFADITRLRELLGCQPQIGLTNGLQRFARWVKTQPLVEDRLEKANAEMKARRLIG